MNRTTLIEHSDKEWDATIAQSLEQDVHSLPAFPTVPAAGLVAKLAVSSPTHIGFFSSLAGKFTLFVAGAVVVGAAFIVIPSMTPPPEQTVPSAVGSGPVIIQRPSEIVTPEQSAGNVSNATRSEVPASAPKEAAKPARREMKLDDPDGKDVRKITRQGYQPPLK